MKNLLSKFKIKKTKYPAEYLPPLEYVVITYNSQGFNLQSQLINKYELEQLILNNRESIKYIFEYKDRLVISNELVEIEKEEIHESND